MHSAESPTGILFLNDLDPSEMVPIKPFESRRDLSLMDSSSEFEFCISSSFEHESSSADELFFNGVILPTQNQDGFLHSKGIYQCESAPFLSSSLPPQPPAAATENSKKEITKEIKVITSESEKKSRTKSFWGFRRSNSLTHDCRRKSSFCSLPLLSRSNSTGSVPNQKRTTPVKDGKRQISTLQKEQSVSEGKSRPSFSSSLFSNSASNSYSKLQRTHSRKNHGGFYGNSLYITPILNIPPPYITKETANIFGLSSLLRSGKEKKSRT